MTIRTSPRGRFASSREFADPSISPTGAGHSSIDNVAWLLHRAVAAAPDADRLAIELPASDNEYLLDVYDTAARTSSECVDQHAG